MNNAKISIIVPVYKVEEYLDECVESVVSQSYNNLEIILVDDGSPDNCGDICDKWSQKDSRIKVIHKENGGLSDARNAGLEIATGDYIFFLDSDDYIEQNCISDLYGYLGEYDAEIAVTSKTRKPFENIINPPIIADDSKEMLILMYKKYFWEGCGKLYKASLFKNLKYKKGILYEDFHLTPRVILESNKIVYADTKQYYYRVRSGSIMRGETKADLIINADENLKYFKNKGLTHEQYNAVFKEIKKELNTKRLNSSKTNKEYIKAFKEFEHKYLNITYKTHSLYCCYRMKLFIYAFLHPKKSLFKGEKK